MTSEFQRELDAEIEKLKAQRPKDRFGKDRRYKKGYRVEETIRMYTRRTAPNVVQFSISYDLVHQMWRWRDRYPKEGDRIPDHIATQSRIEFLRFTDGIPGCLMRLEQMAHYRPNGNMLQRPKNSWAFTVVTNVKKLGILPNPLADARQMEFIPWPEMGGYILMFEPHEMAHAPNMTTDEFRDYANDYVQKPIGKFDYL